MTNKIYVSIIVIRKIVSGKNLKKKDLTHVLVLHISHHTLIFKVDMTRLKIKSQTWPIRL